MSKILDTLPYFCNFCIQGHTNIRPPATNAGLLWQTPAKKGEIAAGHYLHCDLFSRSMQPHAQNTCGKLNSIPSFGLCTFYCKSTKIKVDNVRKYLIQPWPHSVHKFRRIPFWNLSNFSSQQKFLVRSLSTTIWRQYHVTSLWRRLLIVVDNKSIKSIIYRCQPLSFVGVRVHPGV